MAPLTRRESTRLSSAGLEAGSSSQLPMDEILANFEQYRRKHAAQNRDIVHANALAHARIRELESRVLELEGECAEHKLAASRQAAQVRRLEYALECIRVGWETMGHALRDGGVPTPEKTRSKAAAALPTPPRVPSSTRVVLMDGLPTTRIHVARPTPLPSEWVQEDHTSPLPTPTADEHDAERMSCESTQRPDDMCPASVTRRRPSRRHSGMVPPPRLEVAAADEVAAITPPPPPPPPPPPAATADVDVDVPCTPTSTRDEPVETPTPTPTRPKSKTPQKRARRTSVLSELGMTDDVVPDRARRARKSVNYALPKLNTKMRKPDPTEEGPTSKKPRTSRTHPKDEPSTPRAASPSLTTDDTPSEVAAARPRRSRTSSTQSAAAEEAKEAAVAPAMDVDATALAPPRTPLPTSVRSSRSGTPFVPSRGRHVNAGLLQQQSSHNMPSWASSLMHLASPEPPASKVSAAPSTRRRRSVAVHEKENEGS